MQYERYLFMDNYLFKQLNSIDKVLHELKKTETYLIVIVTFIQDLCNSSAHPRYVCISPSVPAPFGSISVWPHQRMLGTVGGPQMEAGHSDRIHPMRRGQQSVIPVRYKHAIPRLQSFSSARFSSNPSPPRSPYFV